jgi:hypothetical protein
MIELLIPNQPFGQETKDTISNTSRIQQLQPEHLPLSIGLVYPWVEVQMLRQNAMPPLRDISVDGRLLSRDLTLR